MVLKQLKGLWDSGALRLFSSTKTEIELTDNCVERVERKRKRALKRANERRMIMKQSGAPVLSDWEKDDRYADDEFYKEELAKCYKENRPVKRAMGLP